jgi:hypothetical protein
VEDGLNQVQVVVLFNADFAGHKVVDDNSFASKDNLSRYFPVFYLIHHA